MCARAMIIVAAIGLGANELFGVTLFFDRGALTEGVQGGPINNSNAVIALPVAGVRSVYLWAIPEADNMSIVASLGHDIAISGTAANAVTAAAYVLDNPAMGPGTRWSGTALTGGLNEPGKLVEDARAVFLPTALPFSGGIGSANLATDPARDPNGTGSIFVARLDLAGAESAVVGTSAQLRLVVSPLRIAKVTTGTPGAEPLRLGFQAGGAEPATGTGSVLGATSTLADATIVIVGRVGDIDGDNDVDLVDFLTFSVCFSGAGVLTIPDGCSAGDFADCDVDDDGDVDLNDFLTFSTEFTG